MTDKLKLARYWYRRIAEGVAFASLLIVGLFAWTLAFGTDSLLGVTLPVSETAALLAGISLFIAVVSFFWTPRKYPFLPSLIAYTALWLSLASLILTTGNVDSPFITLWVLVAIFSGVFGVYGFIPVAVAPVAYLSWRFIDGSFDPSDTISVLLAGGVPLVLSYLAWITPSSAADKSYRTYQQLASELSQVSGKAEVVINAITDGVVALNNQGVIQLINPAAQQMIGWGKQDALMLNYKSVLKFTDDKGGELTAANDPVVHALATNSEQKSDTLTMITNSGKKLLVSLVVSPVGQPGSGVLIVFRDITSEKAEERQQAEFISTASHEMRTPVASIEGYLGLALNPATAQIDAKAREFITKAHESAEHLGRLFQDLLDVSRAEDGRLASKPGVVDVVAFTQDIVQGLRPKAEAKGLHMIFKPQPGDAPEELSSRRLNPVYYANVDNDHLREIISNLVENAIKYTPSGTVTIDVGGDADHVVLSVEDSGIGIPAEDQPHLFQKFYRVDNSDTREIGGTGLGLYLCRRLAEAMDGRIWVESEYKKGSSFYVEIPRISHEEAMQLIETVERQTKTSDPSLAVQPTLQPAPTTAIPPQTPDGTPTPSESTFVTPSADVIAGQLNTLSQNPASSAPTLPVQNVNLSGQTPPTPTTPTLAAIEQYPEQYLRRQGGVNVPPRQKNQP